MKSLIFSLTTAFCFSAIAHTNIVGSKARVSLNLDVYGQESKFETLKNGYENAYFAADASDFEMYNAQAANRLQRCVVADEKSPNELKDIIVARYSIRIAGTPGNGPMFPSTPDRLESKLMLGQSGIFTDKMFPVFINETTNTDFVVRVPQNNVGVYSDVGGDVNIYFRREKNYFPFKVVKLLGGSGPQFPAKESVLFYGYCYNK